ncbi:MAG: class I SAM-dependent methyltransferase [Elusimicrobia bacterium]|nr:class I SAM-dependent methyltransferase [Elusimicrobiota bacterium]
MIYKNSNAQYYLRTYAQLRNYPQESHLIYRVFVREAPRDGFLLDLGCGPGGHLKELAKMTGDTMRLIGMDASRELVELSSRDSLLRGRILNADLTTSWPIASQTVAMAYTVFNLYQSLTGQVKRRRFLLELVRCLKPNGVFLLDAHNERVFRRAHPPGIITKLRIPHGSCEIQSKYIPNREVKEVYSCFKVSLGQKQIVIRNRHRMMTLGLDEIAKELSKYGFRIIQAWGNWSGSPFRTKSSERIIAAFIRTP